MSVMARKAQCQCGRLRVVCRGSPVRISVCHCLDCQRRGGAPFAMQARFPADMVEVMGVSTVWVRTTDSGNTSDHHFCPTCGSTLWYHSLPHRDLYAIPVGAFADPEFPPPQYSVWETRKHAWIHVDVPGIERSD